jgi:hypothetical protein
VQPYSFSTVPRTSGPIFIFCASELIFNGTEGVGSYFHVLRFRTHFGQYRGRWVQFSYFALSASFSTEPRASGPVFMFCAPRLISSGTKGVGSRFHILHSQTHFQRYQGRRVLFSCFALLDSFRAKPRAPSPGFMFRVPGLVFGGTEGVGSRFHFLLSRTRFRQYRGRWVPFSCFMLPYSFSTA